MMLAFLAALLGAGVLAGLSYAASHGY